MKKFTIISLLVLAILFALFMLILGATATGPDVGVAKGISKMAVGLIILWIFIGGGLMYRFRDQIRDRVRAIPLRWEIKFVLFAALLACIEEAITTFMTNLAPQFGSKIGEAYITASTNYFDVIFLHSVFPVILPLFIGWMIILRRYDFKPFSVFLLFGIMGVFCEVMFSGPSALFGFPMWMFVYGLMIYLPVYSLPENRGARPVNFLHYLFVLPAVLLVAFVLLLPSVFFITQVLQHPRIDFESMQ